MNRRRKCLRAEEDWRFDSIRLSSQRRRSCEQIHFLDNLL